MLEFKIKTNVPPTFFDSLYGGLKAAAMRGSAQAAQKVLNHLRVASSRGPLSARTGMLQRSWTAGPVTAEQMDSGEAVRVVIDPLAQKDSPGGGIKTGSSMPYAAIHEFGGDIKPVKAKALTIPIAANLTAAGVPRYATAQELKDHFGADKVFLMKREGKAPLLMAQTGAKTVKPFFVLSKGVKIPARKYVSEALKNAEPEASAALKRAIDTGGGE